MTERTLNFTVYVEDEGNLHLEVTAVDLVAIQMAGHLRHQNKILVLSDIEASINDNGVTWLNAIGRYND